MANVRWIEQSVLEGSTMAASSAVSGLPPENIIDRHIRKSTSSTGKANEWWRFRTSGGATGINHVYVVGDFSVDAIVLWQGNTTSLFTGTGSGNPLNTTLAVPTDALGHVIPHISHFYSNVTHYAFWRLYVEDTGNASSQIQVNLVHAGRYTEPTQNIREGFQLSYTDPSRVTNTGGRQGYANVRKKYAEIGYSVFQAGEPQQDEFIALFRRVGQHKAFVFSLEPDRSSHYTWYGQFQGRAVLGSRVLSERSIETILFSEKN